MQELITIVNYFAKADWKPVLLGDDFYTVGGEVIRRRINNFFRQNAVTEIFPYQPFSIWEKDRISLQYSGDSLRYFINDSLVPFRVNSNLPVTIRDRHLFFQQDSIFVIQDMQTIKSIAIDKSWKDTSEDFDIYVFPKWVNICWGGKDNWVYSYSYDKNRFYKNRK